MTCISAYFLVTLAALAIATPISGNVIDDAVDAVEDAYDTTASWVDGAADTVASAHKDAYDTVASATGSIMDDVSSAQSLTMTSTAVLAVVGLVANIL
ncbi:hypothetical protein PHMEG_00021562 [Phytophthora megakarya]|uniref:Secreted protein n=1 Tax=Phytophthora megakarya TaxID=4795 RepID=A0A225VLA6_9STRA|nr:hypothetical protein PHMEG_00021562 [Phytophthora megakarya]